MRWTVATRLERVVLELVDQFTPGAAKAAGSAQFLATRLDGIDTSAVKADRGLTTSSRGVDNFRKKVDQTSPSIDRLSGRLGLLAKGFLALGPAAVPITGAMIPALAGMATEMGAAALAGGVLMASFQGVGDALEAVNKYRLAPTAKNLAAAREQMAGLSKDARQAVRAMADLRPVLIGIRDAGAAGFFPGFTDGLDDFEKIAPSIERIFHAVGGSAGGLFKGALDDLSSDEWAPFLNFVEREAPAALTTLGHTVGNLTKGVAELWMAMDPLSDDFSGGLLKASESFETWAEGISKTEGYREFIDYVRDTGPEVVETVGSLANAVLQIGEAAAPLGGPVLQVVETFADTVATIADSPLGPVIMSAATAMSALSLATSAFNKVADASFGKGGTSSIRSGVKGLRGDIASLGVEYSQFNRTGSTTAALLASQSAAAVRTRGAMLKAGAGAAALGLAYVGVEKGLIGANTALGAGVGMIAGPWGAAVGGGIGLLIDFANHTDDATKNAEAFAEAMQQAVESGGPVSEGTIAAAEAKYAKLKAEYDKTQKLIYGPTYAELRAGTDPDPTAGGWADAKDYLSGIGPGGRDSEKQAAALKQAKEAVDQLKASMDAEAGSLGYASAAARDNVAAMRELHDATLGAINAELNWKQSLLTANKTVRENGRVLDSNGHALKGHEQAAIDSQRAIAAVAAAWNDQAASGKASAAELDQTKAAIRRMGEQAGLGRGQIRELIDALDAVPPKKQTNLQVKTEQAKVKALQAAIDALRGKTIDIFIREWSSQITGNAKDRVNGVTSGKGTERSGSDYFPNSGKKKGKGSADGSTVPKDGGPYADRYPYLLAPGEEVITNRNGQADRHRPLLKAINAGRLADGGTVGFANGGTVGGNADSRGVTSLGREAEKSAKEIKKEREARAKAREERQRQRLEDKLQQAKDRRDAVAQARDSLASTVGDRFKSGLFGGSQSGWVSSVSDWKSKLKGDISQAKQFNGYRATLQKKGLSGAAAEALFSEADLATIQMFAAMSPAELAEYEALFNERDRLAGAAGSGVGDLVYGDDAIAANHAVHGAAKQLKAFNQRHRKKRRHRRRRRHPQRHADGGTVLGDLYPYGDKTLILAAPGEEVITNRNGEADQFRADRDAGRIPAYANGGTVRPPTQQRRSYAATSARLGMQRSYGHMPMSQREGRPIEINVAGDSSRDPEQMARETARRLAFEGV
jgi:hypothetical protein